jgi:hypothetical protein
MQAKTLYATSGETIKVSNQWAAEAEKRGTTVSSSTWTYSGAGTFTNKTLATPLTGVMLAPTSCGTLANTITLANGETLTRTRCVVVEQAPGVAESA